jgi:hypothetical protein
MIVKEAGIFTCFLKQVKIPVIYMKIFLNFELSR